jgi:hypothetical protein
MINIEYKYIHLFWIILEYKIIFLKNWTIPINLYETWLILNLKPDNWKPDRTLNLKLCIKHIFYRNSINFKGVSINIYWKYSDYCFSKVKLVIRKDGKILIWAHLH